MQYLYWGFLVSNFTLAYCFLRVHYCESYVIGVPNHILIGRNRCDRYKRRDHCKFFDNLIQCQLDCNDSSINVST